MAWIDKLKQWIAELRDFLKEQSLEVAGNDEQLMWRLIVTDMAYEDCYEDRFDMEFKSGMKVNGKVKYGEGILWYGNRP